MTDIARRESRPHTLSVFINMKPRIPCMYCSGSIFSVVISFSVSTHSRIDISRGFFRRSRDRCLPTLEACSVVHSFCISSSRLRDWTAAIVEACGGSLAHWPDWAVMIGLGWGLCAGGLFLDVIVTVV